MKVLVTGGCGFLGSHVCEYFAAKGDEVVSFDNMTKYELKRTGFATEKVRDFNRDFLRSIDIDTVIADVRDAESLMAHAKGCDYIVHTAAQPAMTISWEEPELDMTTNVVGTFNVLEIARKLEIPVAVCSSIHVYGNEINASLQEGEDRYIRNPAEINENYPLLEGKLSPLHVSKASAELYVKTYIDTYNIEAAVFRLTGIYGPRQFGGEDHGWVANFSIRNFLDRPITFFGTGKQVRDIIYATDVCEAFDAFYQTRKSGVYNIGGGSKTAISLLQCVDILRKITGKKPEVKFDADRFGDLRYFICDTSKAQENLGWSAKTMPETGIRELVDWLDEVKDLLK
ncbi:MAG: NAD-dependent epimerase/dehydratase family protein [Rhodospirillales bacterium]|nr:NAD-dependent epimerase/dehydratase family protein [Rhodospirillales bacterium]